MGIGYISKEYTFWCGNEECGEWEQFSGNNKKDTIEFARKHGWRNTTLYGWICPKCSKVSRG